MVQEFSPENEQYIRQHRTHDVRALALKRAPEGVDVKWCLQQIEGWQTAQKKLPSWAATEGLWYPVKLSMEQCSSELTATYKRELAESLIPADERCELVDLTAGFGVDFMHMAQAFGHGTCVERMESLCHISQHNQQVMGMQNTQVVCGDGVEYLQQMQHDVSMIFLDPARRDDAGRKTVAIEDCTPDVTALQSLLCARAPYIIIKLSPMLDISQALRAMPRVTQVHVVSVQGECKELLLVMTRQQEPVRYRCVNLNSGQPAFDAVDARQASPVIATGVGRYLYEPNASILKAGVQDMLCSTHRVEKLHPMSHLFTSHEWVEDFPGRAFVVEDYGDMGKQAVRRLTADLKQANLTVRNFPATVAELRKKLRLKEGGASYLFATTIEGGRHLLIRCSKP